MTRTPTASASSGHEGIYLASFDLDRLPAYRLNEVWGNAFRKPDRYQVLISPDVEPPFIRPGVRTRTCGVSGAGR